MLVTRPVSKETRRMSVVSASTALRPPGARATPSTWLKLALAAGPLRQVQAPPPASVLTVQPV